MYEQEDLMNDYWDERSVSYSEMTMKQLHTDRKKVWEDVIFPHVKETYKDVLDIGTGPGFFAILMALHSLNVTAVDMNEEMLKFAKKNAINEGVTINFLQVGHDLPFVGEWFDVVISRDVTWTLTEPEEQLKSWMSIVRKGGKLLYFDAEWNYHLRDEEGMKHWENAKKSIQDEGIEFYEKANELDEASRELPMTYKNRPKWDRKFWECQGYECHVYEKLNKQIFNREEQIHYQTHPVFLVEVVKNSY
ncbi:Methyltransferase [Lachnospiraceae bacterium TWA4]|nr:Methyltransferase [Lachnospiraceae bacterium TWA4]